uniref:hypothetical protein n=1 Tax=uncultured Alistipes sp. TaxID=538949 RepID=UPI00262F6F02
DPRWWTVSVPETVIASELTAVTEDYEWPLSDDLVFEPQSITETIIYGNLQFIASNEVFPVTITSDHTISLSGATSFTADGEPTNNALAIRVSAAGSLVLTPSNAGIGVQLEVIAGENRYTFEMPGSKVRVSARFTRTGNGADMPFRDVASGAYYQNTFHLFVVVIA